MNGVSCVISIYSTNQKSEHIHGCRPAPAMRKHLSCILCLYVWDYNVFLDAFYEDLSGINPLLTCGITELHNVSKFV